MNLLQRHHYNLVTTNLLRCGHYDDDVVTTTCLLQTCHNLACNLATTQSLRIYHNMATTNLLQCVTTARSLQTCYNLVTTTCLLQTGYNLASTISPQPGHYKFTIVLPLPLQTCYNAVTAAQSLFWLWIPCSKRKAFNTGYSLVGWTGWVALKFDWIHLFIYRSLWEFTLIIVLLNMCCWCANYINPVNLHGKVLAT